ncbi:MAG: serine--tRNA ligase [Alphaproteobacteria bacterium]|nr:MAG: serine--tRNA ligase [Alphaproteobacteria bacterium]
MIDLKLLKQNIDATKKRLPKFSKELDQMLALDEQLRAEKTKLEDLLRQKNEIANQIPAATDRQPLIQKGEQVKTKIQEQEGIVGIIAKNLLDIAIMCPNIPQDDVPMGIDENDNVEVKKWGKIKALDFKPKEHFDLVPELMDFESASLISGARFVFLKKELALLHRALKNFMLDILTQKFGYTEMDVPLLVLEKSMFGTGQLPKLKDDLFQTTGEHMLIPTAEVSLTNYVREKILKKEDLPMRLTAATPCFRKEAGAAGKDTRGLIRQHQFYKVEMVSIVNPEDSNAELERMLGCAETILQQLNIPYRVILLCTGDMGFASSKTYDIEVWLPGQDRYREISSCSNCQDFQARRMKTRIKEDKGTVLAHTLNGSGLAVGRTLLAVLENYQTADGSIEIPEVLLPYMNGVTKIG